jgi:TonB family protein
MFTAAVVATLLSVPGPAQQPPRDPARPTRAAPSAVLVPDTAAVEADLAAKIAASPASPTTLPLYFQLSKLQEARGAFTEAEATLLRARQAAPSEKNAPVALAHFYSRRGQFDQAIAALETGAQLDAGNPQSYLMIATFYWEKISKDKALAPAQQLTYIMEGVSAADRALALDADHAESLTYKNLLLRQRAGLETDPVQKQQLVAEADALRNRAMEINRTRASGRTGPNASVSRQPMGPDGVPGPMSPVRVGGNVKTPTKVRDAKPVYPPEAQSAGVQGIIILEATVAGDGRVADARVLRSIPLLDQAALDAVRSWEFTPTYLNGVPVPVIMTVTVNFTLQ